MPRLRPVPLMPEEAVREGADASEPSAPRPGAGVPIRETGAAWGTRDLAERVPGDAGTHVAAAQPVEPSRAVADSQQPDGRAGVTPPRRRGGASRPLAAVVAELGFMTAEQVERATADARAKGQSLEAVLTGPDGLTADQLARATAERFGLDHVDLATFRPDLAAVNLVGATAARRLQAVPLCFEGPLLVVAMAQPQNVHALDDVKLMTGHEVRRVVASPEDIAGLISRMNRLDEAVAEAVAEDAEGEQATVVAEVRESADDAPVIKLVNQVVAQAVEDRASDIHFEPEGRDMRVRFRIDGVLRETATIPRRMVAGVVSRVKIMGDLDIAERRVPQDGRVSMRFDGRPLDIRIVTLPSVHGEGIVMRILDKGNVMHSLDTLGMPEQARVRFEAAFRQSYGAVLVTGPTGSGKSTTLYGALNAINTPERNIITIEDPVEYQLGGITQIQVNPKAGLTFASGLRSMLRADPDVIMVGEIRDADTARIAVESALTGHLVLSTLHTNDAASAITRLSEMGIAPFLTASAVDCVVAQRLARRLCRHCKQPVELSADVLAAAGFAATDGFHGWEPHGCQRCNDSGYKGRTGLYEVMTVSEEIRSLTVERTSADVIKRVAEEQGMRPLRLDGLDKVREGLTSLAEVARVS